KTFAHGGIRRRSYSRDCPPAAAAGDAVSERALQFALHYLRLLAARCRRYEPGCRPASFAGSGPAADARSAPLGWRAAAQPRVAADCGAAAPSRSEVMAADLGTLACEACAPRSRAL